MSYIMRRKPDLSCLDGMSLDIGKKPQGVRGSVIGAVNRRGQVVHGKPYVPHPRARVKVYVKHPRLDPEVTPEEVEAEIAKIRREKELLYRLGKGR